MNKQQFIRALIGNFAIRVMAYPYIIAKHYLAEKKYLGTEFPERIRNLKGAYEGKRCFIVGNGPSLTLQNLDILHERGEICFGMNHIYDLFAKTEWRPDFYFCFDRDFIRSDYKKIISLPIDNIFIEYSKAPRKCIVHDRNVYYYFSDYVFAAKRGTAITDHVCTSLDMKTSFVTNTTHLCIEFALYMGFSEIYLIGIDHDYSFGYGMNHAKGISEGIHNDKKNYCTSDLNVSTNKYEQYQKYAIENGVRIVNASEGGKLDVFERVNFLEIM